MMLPIILDGFLIILLGVTIAFAVAVNRKLDTLRSTTMDLEQLSATFANSTARTEDGLSRLKVAARTTEEDRQRTERLADDLRYLIERGDALADRLEVAVKAARASETVVAPPRQRPAPQRARPAAKPTTKSTMQWPEADDLQPRSQAERQLLQALRASSLTGATTRETACTR